MKQIDATPMGSKNRKFMIYYLLDKLDEMRGQGPAYYEIEPPKNDNCMVKYRSVSHEARKGNLDCMPEPGPDYYYCKDDLIKIKNPQWVFNKSPRIKKLKIKANNKTIFFIFVFEFNL